MDEMRAEDLVMTERNKEFKELARNKDLEIVPGQETTIRRLVDEVPDATVKLTSHTIHYESPAGNESPLPAAICSCGWKKSHARFKTVYLKALEHSKKTGHIMLEKGS